MLRHNVENQSEENDDVELSRRSFFGRLAVGAFLSIGMPGIVHAAKSAAVKADKNKRLAQSAKTAVRLPKNVAIKATKAMHQSGKVSASHHVLAKQQKDIAGKYGKLSKTLARNNHAIHSKEHKGLRATHEQHSSHSMRVRDMYGKNKAVHIASNHPNRDHVSGSRVHSIIQPGHGHRESILNPAQEPIFLADHGRFSTHRALAFQNPHTGDKLNLTYFEKGRYLNDALNEISFLLRDYRTGDVHPIDPELLDQLHDLKQMLGLYQPFDVICGYRSPLTNARLHAEHSGVANNSFHMHGRAVDIRIERFDLRRIHNAALAMHRGGVGFYPESNFIHLDTGTFRTWSL
ncbi:MAG: hypothetical protein CTY19_08735 [Methylomonas sp.]|nr:MAG: hypothetical protein CTY19_08735 [Methylomonas sp.]